MKTNINRIKTIIILTLFVLFALFFVRSGCSRKKAEELVEKVTELNVVNDILKQENSKLDIELENEIIKRRHLEAKLDTLAKDKNNLLNENRKLKGTLVEVSGKVNLIPTDSSYKFLDEKAYPDSGEKKYPFSEPQVKAIHVTYVENEMKDQVINNQQAMIDNCETRVIYKDKMIDSYIVGNEIKDEKIENLTKIADNSEEKATIYEKQLRKQKRKSNLFKFTTVAGTIVITLLLL